MPRAVTEPSRVTFPVTAPWVRMATELSPNTRTLPWDWRFPIRPDSIEMA